MCRANTKAIWDNLKPGETVLIEHSSRVEPTLLFHDLLKWANEKGYPVVIDDVLDTLYGYRIHIKLAGLEENILDGVKVIKIGGNIDVGQVIKRLEIKEPVIQARGYKNTLNSLLNELSIEKTVIVPVLGFEKLFLLADSVRDILNIVHEVRCFIGDERRIELYFVNTDVLERTLSVSLPLLEELASTIIEVDTKGGFYKFSVVKSVNNKLLGLEFTML